MCSTKSPRRFILTVIILPNNRIGTWLWQPKEADTNFKIEDNELLYSLDCIDKDTPYQSILDVSPDVHIILGFSHFLKR